MPKRILLISSLVVVTLVVSASEQRDELAYKLRQRPKLNVPARYPDSFHSQFFKGGTSSQERQEKGSNNNEWGHYYGDYSFPQYAPRNDYYEDYNINHFDIESQNNNQRRYYEDNNFSRARRRQDRFQRRRLNRRRNRSQNKRRRQQNSRGNNYSSNDNNYYYPYSMSHRLNHVPYNINRNNFPVYEEEEGYSSSTTEAASTTTLAPFDVSDIKVPAAFLRQEYMISFSFLGLIYGLGFLVLFQSLCVPTAKIVVTIVYYILVRLGVVQPYTIQDVLEQVPPTKKR